MPWYHKVRWDLAVNRRCEAERSGGQIDQDQLERDHAGPEERDQKEFTQLEPILATSCWL